MNSNEGSIKIAMIKMKKSFLGTGFSYTCSSLIFKKNIYYTVSIFYVKYISCITLISLTICSTLCIMSQTVGMIIYVSFYLCRLLLLTVNFVVCVLFDPSLNVRAGILKIITEMFLPHIGLSELEEECFSKILPKVHIMLF